MEYIINIPEEKYHRAILNVINCFLALSKFEMDIVCQILDDENGILTTKLRREIRLKTEKGEASTNNYVKMLKDKKVLIGNKGEIRLNDTIMKLVEDGEVFIKFNILTNANQV
jgi:predicted transcriptional regulator